MPNANKRIGFLLLALGLLACGGSIKGNTGPDACATLGACACMAAADRCAALTEACWCPSECNPQIACICGGGQFIACDDRAVVATCASALAAVQAKCTTQSTSQSFVQYIGDICTSVGRSPTCVAACLANLQTSGSCAEIDCSFCPVCDCAGPTTPSPFAACLAACALPD